MLARLTRRPFASVSTSRCTSRKHCLNRSRMSTRAGATALVPVAEGTEEMEAVIIVDVLRRAGVDVSVASVEPDLLVHCSRGVKLQADISIEAASGPYDAIVLPGGMPGAERLNNSVALAQMLSEQKSAGRLYAAICAAPAVVFKPQGLLDNTSATCHPGFFDKLDADKASEERVVTDGLCITSRGPGTAFEFALKLVEQLCGPDKRDEVAGPMVMYSLP